LRLDVFTLFPEWFEWFLGQRHVRNATERGSEIRLFDYRATTPLGGGQVDDSPYGGGAGMVLRIDVVCAALESVYGDVGGRRVVAFTPPGRPLDQALVEELAREDELTLLSARFEGFDERILEHVATDAVSIGPYVLSGGELPAMVLLDALARRLPGAIREESAAVESFSEALGGGLEFPHYTRPAEYRGWRVPDVLLSGNHDLIERWRLERSRERSLS
jgi:tRNA (guanine37-N1)-methyltransferase